MNNNLSRRKNKENYLKITRKDIPEIFEIKNGNICLKNSRAFPFKIKLPLILDEEIARISAMILDGSISKNLTSCMFSQKKDPMKVIEFSNIIKQRFNRDGNFSVCKDTKTNIINYSRKVFISFLYYCLNLHKSDEPAHIPKWIWNSSKQVIIEYLRYAFAMEGSVEDPLKGKEVRFHSTDLSYLKELQRLLRKKFDIKFCIISYYIRGYGLKYYLRTSDKKEVTKFGKIGFALKSHQKRLEAVINSFKSKAWEITLVSILKFKKEYFRNKDINGLFPYLCKRAIHDRIVTLRNKKYLIKEKRGYKLTDKGYRKAKLFKKTVKVTPLRTNPKRNEQRILDFLKINKKGYRNEIARKLKINTQTVADVLKRLLMQDKIKFINSDKFQRKFYKVSNNI